MKRKKPWRCDHKMLIYIGRNAGVGCINLACGAVWGRVRLGGKLSRLVRTDLPLSRRVVL